MLEIFAVLELDSLLEAVAYLLLLLKLDMMLLADGKPVVIETTFAQQFKISAEQLEAAITPKTKLLIMNSPSNPSGMVYSKGELEKLANVLLKYPQVLITTDDMYEPIYWAKEPFSNIVNACPQLYDRTIVLNGVSKSYAMTGWRIGYAAGPQEIIAAMIKIQSQNTSNPNSIAQMAAQAALEGDQTCVADMNKIFKERHDYVYGQLKSIKEIDCLPSEGSFYSFFGVKKIMQQMALETDMLFSEALLNDTGIATVPGSAFGTPDFIRISFATSMENLQKAFERLKVFLNAVVNQ
jgi:aspartate aminotransferase